MRIIIVLLVVGLLSCNSKSQELSTSKTEPVEKAVEAKEQIKETFFVNTKGEKIEKIEKSADEWGSQLTKMEFYVIREKGTERSHTGDLLQNKKNGNN